MANMAEVRFQIVQAQPGPGSSQLMTAAGEVMVVPTPELTEDPEDQERSTRKGLPPSIVATVEDLFDLVTICRKPCCAHESRSSRHCPLCPPSTFKPTTRLYKVKSHLILTHWNKRIGGDTDAHPNGLYAVPCWLRTCDLKGRHFHCTICLKSLRKKVEAGRHIERCRNPLNPPCRDGEADDDHDYSVFRPLKRLIPPKDDDDNDDDDLQDLVDDDDDVDEVEYKPDFVLETSEAGVQDVASYQDIKQEPTEEDDEPLAQDDVASAATEIEILMDAARQTYTTKVGTREQGQGDTIVVNVPNTEGVGSQQMQYFLGSDGNTYMIAKNSDGTSSSSGHTVQIASPSKEKLSVHVPDIPTELLNMMEDTPELASKPRVKVEAPVFDVKPPPKKRRKFHSQEERIAARREIRRKYEERQKLSKKNIRVFIGSMVDAWERQRERDGFTSQGDFIKHVLAVHDKYCTYAHQPLVSSQNKANSSAPSAKGSAPIDIRGDVPPAAARRSQGGQPNTSVYIVIKNEPGTPDGGDEGSSSTFRVM